MNYKCGDEAEMSKRDCKHGHLARSCELCELDTLREENTKLKELVREARHIIKKLTPE